MTVLFRKIRKSKWYKSEAVPWLENDDLQSDAIDDLNTTNNELSVYAINDDSDLARVIAGMAANCDRLSNLDYALLDEEVIGQIGIKAKRSEGDLSDAYVAKQLHRDLYELSASGRLALATAIQNHARIERAHPKQVLEFVAKAIVTGSVPREALRWSSSDLKKLNAFLPPVDAGLQT